MNIIVSVPLYPYGKEEDTMIPIEDDSCSDPVVFDQGIPIFDDTHTKVYVSFPLFSLCLLVGIELLLSNIPP